MDVRPLLHQTHATCPSFLRRIRLPPSAPPPFGFGTSHFLTTRVLTTGRLITPDLSKDACSISECPEAYSAASTTTITAWHVPPPHRDEVWHSSGEWEMGGEVGNEPHGAFATRPAKALVGVERAVFAVGIRSRHPEVGTVQSLRLSWPGLESHKRLQPVHSTSCGHAKSALLLL